MVVLRVNNADLPKGWTHDKTDWQVATDEEFKDILVESRDDSENLTTIIFNNKLELGKKYYGRARMLLNNGFTEWSNIDVFVPKDANEVALNMDIPSIITAPTLDTKFDSDAHPNAHFRVFTNDFSTLGNANHESTTWVIEDSEGKALWASVDDVDNKTSIMIDRYLPVNTLCRVHAAFKGSNGDISQFGTTTFYTSHSDIINVNRELRGIHANVDLDLSLPFIVGLDELNWEFYLDGALVQHGTTKETFFTVDKDNLKPGVTNVIRIKAKVNSIESEWTYAYITPVNENLEVPTGSNIPYNGNNEVQAYPLPLPHKFVYTQD